MSVFMEAVLHLLMFWLGFFLFIVTAKVVDKWKMRRKK